MKRNWNTVKAKLVDPFDPDWERVDEKVKAMIATQDGQGGHVYTPFHLPDSQAFVSPGPASNGSKPSQSPLPTLTHLRETEPHSLDDGSALDAPVPKQRKRKHAPSRNKQESLASQLGSALMASKRAAFSKAKDASRKRDAPDTGTPSKASMPDQQLCGSKRKAGDADLGQHDGHESKRWGGDGGRPTALS